jgi:hypothetical protein
VEWTSRKELLESYPDLVFRRVTADARQIEEFPGRRVDPRIDPLVHYQLHRVLRHLLATGTMRGQTQIRIQAECGKWACL